jgi:hypothetical protein
MSYELRKALLRLGILLLCVSGANPRYWPQDSGGAIHNSLITNHQLPFTILSYRPNPYVQPKLKLIALGGPEAGATPTGPYNADQVLLKVYDAVNGALKANATLSGGSTNPTPRNADQVFLAVYDSVNGAIRVNVVAGGGGATTVNSQTCVLGAACTIPFQTNSGSNTSQAGINLLPSTVNAVGLTVTPTNPGTNTETFEVTGASYTGNAQGLGALTQYGLLFGTGSAGAPSVDGPPTTKGKWVPVWTNTADAATSPGRMELGGFITRLVTGASDSGGVVWSDCGGGINYTYAGAVSESLPIATGASSLENATCGIQFAAGSGTTVTITPASSWPVYYNGNSAQSSSTAVVSPNQTCFISADVSGAAWDWKCHDAPGYWAGVLGLPVPSASTLGGVESLAAVRSNWIDSISTAGVPHASQPALSDLTATVTSPIVKSTNNLACPTCLTGPNFNTVGGIIGAWFGTAMAHQVVGWFTFGQASNVYFPAPFDHWLSNLTAFVSAVSSTTAVGPMPFGIGRFFTTAVQYSSSTFSIPLNASATTAYQGTQTPPEFISAGVPNFAFVGSTAASGGPIVRGISAQILGSTSQILGNNLNSHTVATGATVYTGPSMSDATTTATENLVEVPIPYPSGATAKTLCVFMATANASGGSLTLTLDKNEVAQPLSVIVPLSSIAEAVYCDPNPTHALTLAQGDRIDWSLVNANGSAASGQINGISMELVPSGTATGMIVWRSNGVSLPNTSTTYGTPFTNFQNATEATVGNAMPRAVTGKNLYCFATIAPVTHPYGLTVRQNGTSPASGLTISMSTGASVPGNVSDVVDSIAFSNLDWFTMQYSGTSGGTAPAISSCAMEVD